MATGTRDRLAASMRAAAGAPVALVASVQGAASACHGQVGQGTWRRGWRFSQPLL